VPGLKVVITIQIISEKVDIFQTVKQIPFPDVQQAFNGQQTYRSKIICPFHNERSPSFHVYEDSYYCFGCSEHGDSITFVAKLEDLKPLEAARLIAVRFNLPVDRIPTAEEQRRFNEQQRNRNISQYCINMLLIFLFFT